MDGPGEPALRTYRGGGDFLQIETRDHFVDLPAHKTSSTLFLTFENANPPLERPDGQREPWGYAFLRREGHDVAGVKAKRVDWYRCPDLHRALRSEAFRRVILRHDRVFLYGSSMGGYAALAFAEAVPGCEVIAHNPQSSLAADLAPFDTRYPVGSCQDWSGDFRDAAWGLRAARRAYVTFDPWEPADRRHADRLTGPNVLRMPFPHLGHALPEWLQRMGVLSAIVRMAVAGTLDTRAGWKLARRRRNLARYYLRMAARTRSATLARNLLERAGGAASYEDDAREMLKVYKSHGLWQEALAFLRTPCGNTGGLCAEREISEIHFRDGRPAEALPHARAAMSIHPERADFHVHLAEVLLALGRPAECAEVIEAIRERRDCPAVALRVLARCHWVANRPEDALSAIGEAVSRDPRNAFGRYLHGEYLAGTGRIAEARLAYREALRTAPDFRAAAERLAALAEPAAAG